MKQVKVILVALLVFGIGIFIPKVVVVFASEEPQAYVVLVIDDFGNNGEGTDSMISLNIPITGAVIPGMPFSIQDAGKLHDAGKEVILHIPLEPERGKADWLGPSGILTSMGEEEVRKTIMRALGEVNYAVGMNNHMGSKAMKNERIVNIITDIAKEKYLFFLERDIFLDNEKSVISVKKQMNKLGDIALEKGYAIAIGHVGIGGNSTVQGIKESITTLEEKGIKFITLKELNDKLY